MTRKILSKLLLPISVFVFAAVFFFGMQPAQTATNSITINNIDFSFQDQDANGVVNSDDLILATIELTNTDAVGNCSAGTEVYVQKDPYFPGYSNDLIATVESCDTATGDIVATLSGWGTSGDGARLNTSSFTAPAGDASTAITVDVYDNDDTTPISQTTGPIVDSNGDTVAVDLEPPTITDGNLTVDDSGCTGNIANGDASSESGNGCKIGDTITFQWDNSSGGDNNTDGISSITVNLPPELLGNPSYFGFEQRDLTDGDNDDVYTYDFQIPDGGSDGVNETSEQFTFFATDDSGNETSQSASDVLVYDNRPPTVDPTIEDLSGARGVADNLSLSFPFDMEPFSATASTFDLTMNASGEDCTGETAVELTQAEIDGFQDQNVSVNCTDIGTSSSDYTLTYSDTDVVLQDKMGNPVPTGTIAFSSFSGDTISPVITSYTYQDQDGNGRIDQVVVGLSEGVTVGDPTSILMAEDFSLTPGDFTGVNLPSNGTNYLLSESYGATSATIPIGESSVIDTHDDGGFGLGSASGACAGSYLRDTQGNQTDPCDFFQPDVEIIDGAAPVVASTTPTDGATGVDQEVDVDIGFSEEMVSGLNSDAVLATVDSEPLSISNLIWNDSVDQLTLDFGVSLPGQALIEIFLNDPEGASSGGGGDGGGDLLGAGYADGWGCQEGAFIYPSCTLDCGDPENDLLNDVCTTTCDESNPAYPYCLGDPDSDPDVEGTSYTMSAFNDPGGSSDVESANTNDGSFGTYNFSFTTGGTAGGGGCGGSGVPGQICVPGTGSVPVEETACQVTSPNGGEELAQEDTHTVTWSTSGDIDNINLVYTINNGKTWRRVQSGLENDGEYDWDVPDVNTGEAKVRIDCRDPGGAVLYSDASDEVLTIGDPTTPTEEESEVPYEEPVDIDVQPGDLIKLPNDGDPTTYSDSSVYVIGTDGERHPFPSEKVYRTWYPDFDDINIISEEKMASIELGDPILVRPGTRWVKIQSNPKVFYVEPGSAILRHIADERTAERLGGENWNKNVIDIPPTCFNCYEIGEPITHESLDEDWPDGSLMRVSGEQGISYIDEGYRRPITSGAAMEANNFQERFVEVNDEESWMDLPTGFFITDYEERLFLDVMTP